jgi:hypothetical protein
MMMEVTPGTLTGDNPSTFIDEDIDMGLEQEAAVAAEAQAIDEGASRIEEPKSRKNDPREYVVLEFHVDAQEGDYLTEVARVTARNGINAIRKAFREHVKDQDPHQFVTVPATQFKLIPVQHTKREVGSVSIGA